MADILLKADQIKKYFPIKDGLLSKNIRAVKAVDGVDLQIKRGETLGLVGESGCGKSTTGRLLTRLLDVTEGNIYFEGQNITELSIKEVRKLRREIQMIFQDPYSSLNPRQTVEQILTEPLIVHKIGSPAERKKKVHEMLEVVGLSTYHAKRYPHQFSGGQRQRIGIARALMTRPKLIVADEPVSALDVSVQAQVLNLMDELQKEFGLTYLFIAHDLAVVKHISDRIGVMYLGRLVELTDADKLYEKPLHPYTEALLSAIPIADPAEEQEYEGLPGEIPSPSNPPPGCPFHTRCPKAMDLCKTSRPQFHEAEPGHFAACHLYQNNPVEKSKLKLQGVN